MSSRQVVRAVLASMMLLTLGVTACSSRAGTAPGPAAGGVASPGAVAPDFSARDIEGNDVRLASHIGKDVVLLDFYATWCEPCVQELPHLRKLYEVHKSKGFLILAISVDGPETVANVPGFTHRNRVEFPMLVDGDGRIASLYNPHRAAPYSVLIDRNGKVVFMHEGYKAGDEEFFASEVTRLVGAPAPAGHR
jgi:peroxiredoxin